MRLINQSNVENDKDVLITRGLVNILRENKKRTPDQKKQLRETEQKLKELEENAQQLGQVPQWILDGMQTWIDAFLPNITKVRVYPNQAEPDEQVFGHLNLENLTVKDSNTLHFTYGSLPTEEFTLVGIITSVPRYDEDVFDPLSEFSKESLEDFESVEAAFRGVFRGFDGLEAMVRTIRFPRILVHPIMVYREANG